MAEGAGETISAVLRVLADLSPSPEGQPSSSSIPTDWFQWLPLSASAMIATCAATHPFDQLAQATLEVVNRVVIDRQLGERLAALDQIRSSDRVLRIGWLFVAGTTADEDGKTRHIFHPLVTLPVRVERDLQTALVPAGDVELSPLISDQVARRDLEGRIETGGGAFTYERGPQVSPALLTRLVQLHAFARAAAGSAGLPATALVPATDSPDAFMQRDHLTIVAGAGVYAVGLVPMLGRRASLLEWADRPPRTWTAFHSLYLPEQAPLLPPSEEPVHSAHLLTPVQREAIVRSRTEPLTLLSGAPGTGKSHTISAIACDALSRGESVLVAAKSDATVDALLDLLERAKGPDPIVFGSNERRDALAERLSSGQLVALPDHAVAAAARRRDEALARRDDLRSSIRDQLAAEEVLEDRTGATELRLDSSLDLSLVEQLLTACASSPSGWWARRRQRRSRRHLATLTGTTLDVALSSIRDAIDSARVQAAARTVEAGGGLQLHDRWAELQDADDAARAAWGEWLSVRCRSEHCLNRSTLPTIATLATALRSGRAARRGQLGRLDDLRLTAALPLWVGTLADIDDLLPTIAGLFDLVILDEASSIDQPLAASCLLRGKRAVVAGDPRQLRQVSFISDDQIALAIAFRGIDDPVLAGRLDVRRNSAFDLAAGAAPVLVLDEHFRSRPHLVDFVADRLYDGKVHIATYAPRTQSRDCVELVRTTGHRTETGEVRAEIDHVIADLKNLHAGGARSVGIVTPFRAQADALEEAALGTFTVHELEQLDLRVGTVHAFQGNERDTILISMGIGAKDAAAWRFVEDPHLFAVLVTRARRHMRIYLSADPPPDGLVAAYLADVDSPPGWPDPRGATDRWTTAVAQALGDAGVVVVEGYPAGRHVIDLCVHDERVDVAIETTVHPDGADSHIERRLALMRSDWQFLEAYRSRWDDHRGELAVELTADIRSLVAPTTVPVED